MDAEKHRRSTACGGEDEVGRMARTACVDAKANQFSSTILLLFEAVIIHRYARA